MSTKERNKMLKTMNQIEHQKTGIAETFLFACINFITGKKGKVFLGKKKI